MMSTIIGTEGLDELHALAKRIGLRRAWAQHLDRCPHYDLTPNKRAAAIRAGATPLEPRQMVDQAMQPWIDYCNAQRQAATPGRPIFGVTPPPEEPRGCMDGGGRSQHHGAR